MVLNQIVLGNASVTEVSIPGTAAKLFVGERDVIASIDSKKEFYIVTANYTLPTPTMNKMLDVVNTSSNSITITYGSNTKTLLSNTYATFVYVSTTWSIVTLTA